MSDERVAKLEGINKVLRVNSIFWCVGWVLVMVSMIGLRYIVPWSNKTPDVLMYIGWGIIGLPKILAALKGGIGAALTGPLKADYANVTVDGAGRILSSDSGSESIQMNFIGRLIAIAVVYVLGGLIQIIHLLILSIRYATTAIATKAKSSVIPNGFAIILINVAVLVGGFALGAVVQKVGLAANTAADHAARGVKTTGDFQHALNVTKDGIIIEEYKGKGGNVVIPATFDGLPVVAIHGAFTWNKDITSVVIPDTVTFIGYGAFEDCTKLTQVTLPRNLKHISTGSFAKTGLTSVTIPEGVTDIGNTIFQNCANLTSITLPRSLERVGSRAFTDCTSLVDVRIPSGSSVTYGDYATGSLQDHSIHVEGMGSASYFRDDNSPQASVAYNKRAFFGCSSLSETSKQAIINSGYIGEF